MSSPAAASQSAELSLLLLQGDYFKMTISKPDLEPPAGPEAHFCFQAEYDRNRFYAAATNLAAGRRCDHTIRDAFGSCR